MGKIYFNFGNIKNNIISSDGFTLLELLLAISILIILSTIAVISLDGKDSYAGLERVSSEFEQAVEVAKFNAFNGKKQNNKYSPGFGVHFDTSSTDDRNKVITIFADCNLSKEYDTEEVPASGNLCKNEFIEQYAIDGDFYVLGICRVGEDNKDTLCSSNSISVDRNYSNKSIIFWSPFATIGSPSLDPVSPTEQYFKIEIGSYSNSDFSNSYILVNKYGRSTISIRQ